MLITSRTAVETKGGENVLSTRHHPRPRQNVPVHKRGPLVGFEHSDVIPERNHDGEGREQQQIARHVQGVQLPPFLDEVHDPAGRQPPAQVHGYLHHQAQEEESVEDEAGHEHAGRSNSVVIRCCLREEEIVAVAVGVTRPSLLPPLTSKDPCHRDQTHEGGRGHSAHGEEASQEGVLLLHGCCFRRPSGERVGEGKTTVQPLVTIHSLQSQPSVNSRSTEMSYKDPPQLPASSFPHPDAVRRLVSVMGMTAGGD